MKLNEIIKPSAVSANLTSTKKEDILAEMVDLLGKDIKDKKEVVQVLIEREELGSTGIGQGIAVPHGKIEDTKELHAAIGVSKAGVDFKSLDGEPVYIFFLLIAPKETPGPHLKALARISKILRDTSFCSILKKAETAEKVYELLIKEDERY